MIRSAILFLVIALVTGISGFGVIAGSTAVIAKTIFFIAMLCSWFRYFQAHHQQEVSIHKFILNSKGGSKPVVLIQPVFLFKDAAKCLLILFKKNKVTDYSDLILKTTKKEANKNCSICVVYTKIVNDEHAVSLIIFTWSCASSKVDFWLSTTARTSGVRSIIFQGIFICTLCCIFTKFARSKMLCVFRHRMLLLHPSMSCISFLKLLFHQ